MPSKKPASNHHARIAQGSREKNRRKAELNLNSLTERRAQTAQLKRAAYEQITGLLLKSPIGVATTDSGGRFVLVNRAFCRMTGYSERELYARNWVSITHPEDRPTNFAVVCRVLENKLSSFVLEKRYLTKSGGTVWVRNSTYLLHDHAGDYNGAVALVEDITELKKAQEARRAMSAVLLQLQDEERRRIARELHDSTGQNLAALLMTLAQVKRELPRLEPRTRRAFFEGVVLAKRAAREVRTFSYLLHPPLLDELGLEDALRSYVQGFRDRSGMEVKLLLSRSLPRLPQPVELALFRILQESLNNARVHSGSSRAMIRLHASDGHVLLTVKDFGRGLKNSNGRRKAPGVGIAGMRERVRQLGGSLLVNSSSRGTVVHASVPVTAPGSTADGNGATRPTARQSLAVSPTK